MSTHAPIASARLPVRVPPELLEELRQLARAEAEPLSVVVRRVLRDGVREARLERSRRAGP